MLIGMGTTFTNYNCPQDNFAKSKGTFLFAYPFYIHFWVLPSVSYSELVFISSIRLYTVENVKRTGSLYWHKRSNLVFVIKKTQSLNTIDLLAVMCGVIIHIIITFQIAQDLGGFCFMIPSL